MHVIATAGHVDHGKSTLVRALTGMEPDRWAEEKRRGLTIDLGYAWARLPDVGDVAFVDVPGHRRFIGNMLAGLGPAPAVMVVVAADEGWRQQSEEHLQAIDALRLRHGLVVVTRSDLADPAPALASAVERVAKSSLGTVPAVAVSAVTGAGMDDLRASLAGVCRALPDAVPAGRVRLWIDRAFTMRGSGTVVTGTLAAGRLRVGDRLRVNDIDVSVRGMQSLGVPHDDVVAPARVAVNLRGVSLAELSRGSALLTPDSWRPTSTIDVLLDLSAADVPANPMVHVGTAAVSAQVRPLSGASARLTLATALPLASGDRFILRDPGGDGLLTGGEVLDAAPPPLHRRGDGVRRGSLLLATTARHTGLIADVVRRGHLDAAAAQAAGWDLASVDDASLSAARITRVGGMLATATTVEDWRQRLVAAVAAYELAHPLAPTMPLEVARRTSGLPDRPVTVAVSELAGLVVAEGSVGRASARPDLGPAADRLAVILASLDENLCAAPEQHELDAAGLGEGELAAAESLGLILRLGSGIVVTPTTPSRALGVLVGLSQPFTTSQARQALQTTRRVVIPVLEYLDARGLTRRLDAGHRVVVRGVD